MWMEFLQGLRNSTYFIYLIPLTTEMFSNQQSCAHCKFPEDLGVSHRRDHLQHEPASTLLAPSLPTCWEWQLLHIQLPHPTYPPTASSQWVAPPSRVPSPGFLEPQWMTFFPFWYSPLDFRYSSSFSVRFSHFHVFHLSPPFPTIGLQRISFQILPCFRTLSPDSTPCTCLSLKHRFAQTIRKSGLISMVLNPSTKWHQPLFPLPPAHISTVCCSSCSTQSAGHLKPIVILLQSNIFTGLAHLFSLPKMFSFFQFISKHQYYL